MKTGFIKKSHAEVGRRLRMLRQKQGFESAEAFSERYAIAPDQYKKMELGSRAITLTSLLKVLAIHQMTLEEFFCEQSSKAAAYYFLNLDDDKMIVTDVIWVFEMED